VKAAADGFGKMAYSGSNEKMTFTALPPALRNAACTSFARH